MLSRGSSLLALNALPTCWRTACASPSAGTSAESISGAAAAPSPPTWTPATRAAVMSATKGLTTLCAQILCDRGELDLDAPVAVYWPDYAVAGKDHTLVRE